MTFVSRELAARALPQLAGGLFLTDAGLETELVFIDGVDLPCFAAFPLAATPEGRARLERYYKGFLDLAAETDAGIVLETPTWRAQKGWGAEIGLTEDDVKTAIRAAVDLMVGLRRDFDGKGPAVISGQIGPSGDGYSPETLMTPEEAQAHHAWQIGVFAETEADFVTALTMTHVGEAVGVARAAKAAGMPSVISFTVETDGRLPSGQTLVDAIAETDALTDAAPAYYMINCAHPTHFASVLDAKAPALARLRGLRANASKCSHAELDAATELDDGDPAALGRENADIMRLLPNLNVFGGCCGTDLRHVREIARSVAA